MFFFYSISVDNEIKMRNIGNRGQYRASVSNNFYIIRDTCAGSIEVVREMLTRTLSIHSARRPHRVSDVIPRVYIHGVYTVYTHSVQYTSARPCAEG